MITTSADQGHAGPDDRAGSPPRRSSAGRPAGRRCVPKSDSDVPAPREEAVDLVGDAGDAEDDRRPASCGRRPAVSISATKTGISASRAIVSAFGSCCKVRGNGAGRHECGKDTPVAETLSLPGFVDAHSHGVPARPARARRRRGDFWAWRELMLAEAERQTPELVRREYVAGLPRAARGGLHRGRRVPLPRLRRSAAPRSDAAEEAGIEHRRSCSPPTGAAGSTASVRSRSPSTSAQVEDLRGAGSPRRRRPPLRARVPRGLARGDRRATQPRERLPLHVHADEQPREIEECLAEHGIRPIELLDRTGCLSARTTVVHATHADGAELDLLARAGARICACPTTEADLGDGFLPVERVCAARHRHLHRLGLERPHRSARGAARARGNRAAPDRAGATSSPRETLLCFGADEGAGSLGLEEWDDVRVDLSHPSLARRRGRASMRLVAGCARGRVPRSVTSSTPCVVT